MNVFSIRDIEQLTGIKAHTIRIWEQRHNLLCPKRKESKHRVYDSDDLKFILRVALLYNHGYKISRIACMDADKIRDLTLELKKECEQFGAYVNQLTEATLDFDQLRFERILQNVIIEYGFERTVQHVIFQLLNKIGVLWLAGKIHPCQEHFASALVLKKMVSAIDGLPPVRPATAPGRSVLLFTPGAEFHEIPLLFMQYLLKKNGVPTVYAGKSVSPDALEAICRQQYISQLYFHQVTNIVRCDINTYLRKLADRFPDKEIFFAGLHGCGCKLGNLPVNTTYLQNDLSMLSFSESKTPAWKPACPEI
ncbi:MAG: MerR family transcriptional regulator [Candidatus Pseudobacter hemicellulosilyticus]|uniref:MerR family transcriptional regulator n=1 Tax=Candidatus Pseudobacter hemicellulosilyticus TaxID=3121375 RepID=A0AAJ5WLZ5_9BACT|nr:MAG: MerR family transcriptional regulator [Pseudobacter sp.]